MLQWPASLLSCSVAAASPVGGFAEERPCPLRMAALRLRTKWNKMAESAELKVKQVFALAWQMDVSLAKRGSFFDGKFIIWQ